MENHDSHNYLKINGEDPIRSSKYFGHIQQKESSMLDGSSTHATPSISPTTSLISSDSCFSSCSDLSVGLNSYGRGYQEEGNSDTSQEDPNFSLKGHLQDTTLPTHVNKIQRSNMAVKSNYMESKNLSTRCNDRDVDIIGTSNGEDSRNSGVERASASLDDETGCPSDNDETDVQFWLPPEPEDQEDDVEESVANYDDDDECGDGMKWGKASCLSSFGEEENGSYRFKEETQKAMNKVMHGKFRSLVGQLLKSLGVAITGKDGDSWVEIVTSLSWEAASFVQPDAVEGKAMDPHGYVKIKCIATGIRSQSQVIKGLVFKKHAAHKHMPTTYKNPRLLLIQGSLGLSLRGLSSFESMDQENDGLKSLIEMIEMCQPNVVLVEKTVSRDIQESILGKGMTLVFDMKLHRLERVARCTSSTILSSDSLIGQKLGQCDSFHFEKFVEEHAAPGEGGKRPSKTLMFVEGCPTYLGCTILLKGTHSDELKKIKYVVQCAVVMAYHIILETSFLLDQRAMFSTIPPDVVAHLSLTDQQPPPLGSGDKIVSCLGAPSGESDSSFTIDVPISNGVHGIESHSLRSELERKSSLAFAPYNPVVLSGLSSLSASLKKVMGDSLTTSCQSMSAYFGFDARYPNGQIQTDVQVYSSPEAVDLCDIKVKGSSEAEVLDNEPPHSSSACYEASLDTQNSGSNNEDQVHSMGGISAVLDSESILVLMSSRNTSTGNMCEHSHFSHIKFYKNFDIPLGKFLRENLLNQRLQCKMCGASPEAHFYYYAHHNKQLTIQVRRLPIGKCLPGETEGKLWMWSHCGKHKFPKENSKSKRVLISTAARGLSFGKFLELSFSNHYLFSQPSSCGHSFHSDFLYFFGLGPMVAMFKYSPVVTYSMSLPHQKLEFRNSIRAEMLKKDFENVYTNGILMFQDIEKSLKEMESGFGGLTLNLHGSFKEFSDIEEILKEERCRFEVDIQNIVKNANSDEAAYKFLSLNRVRWELLLESFIWDQRLHSLLSSNVEAFDTKTMDITMQGQTNLKEHPNAEEVKGCEINVENGEKVLDSSSDLEIKLLTSVDANDFPIKEIQADGQFQVSREKDESLTSPCDTGDISCSTRESINANGSSIQFLLLKRNLSVPTHSGDENFLQDDLPSSAQSQMNINIPIAKDLGGGGLDLNPSERGKALVSLSSDVENAKGWMWAPFTEIRHVYMKYLQRGYLLKLECINGHAPESTAQKLVVNESSRLYIPLGTDDYIVSDYEDEVSSIIACALASMKDLPIVTEDRTEDSRKEKGIDAKTYESSLSLMRIFSLSALHWPSNGSTDGIHSSPSFSSEGSPLSSFDGLDLLDSLVSLENLHPEVSIGVRKLPGKRKYTVVCLYASPFRDLRNRCCPSELDYIASLCRCKNWDAKGGKSRSFFAKTLDDRLIIKEITRTEFDSFMKFGPDYFQYMNQCYELRNQTCLAKILGIYQVTIRQAKSGKEIKHDLMVMENLTFGRNIARQYDLKGALHARFNSATEGSGDVLLDQNFVNDMNVSPLYVGRKAKRDLQRAVWNDTTFLNSINVMDYSLLVGVDTQRRELACGIIDYLRQYTWDKQFETWVKSSLVVPKNLLPTVISPKEYKKRFRKFIDTNFLSVPDHWCSPRPSSHCRRAGVGSDDDSHTKSQELVDHDDDFLHTNSQELGHHGYDLLHMKSKDQGEHQDYSRTES